MPSQYTDAILEESFNLETGARSGPRVVLAETPGAWDSAYTCKPQVVQGTFSNLLGDGSTYTYAMYYVGTRQQVNTNNNIGVALSVDGVHWKKYPSPVIEILYPQGYGPAQPVPYNSDGKQAVWLFYENDDPPLLPNHYTQAVSVDGVHFKYFGTITTKSSQTPPTLASWEIWLTTQSMVIGMQLLICLLGPCAPPRTLTSGMRRIMLLSFRSSTPPPILTPNLARLVCSSLCLGYYSASS